MKKLIKILLERLNAWSFMPVSGGMGKHGIPDHIACVPVFVTEAMVGRTVGLFVAVEAKTPERKRNLSEQQKKRIAEIRAAHGIAAVVWDEQSFNEHIVYRIGDLYARN